MKLVFDPNQEFQHDAIEAVLGLFKGIGHQGGSNQVIANKEHNLLPGTMFTANQFPLSRESLLINTRVVQEVKKYRVPNITG